MPDRPHAARHGGSHFADADAARRAIDLARPMIERALADPQVSGAGCLCAIVTDPALPPSSGARFEDAVLLEEDFGTRARWDADYAAFARAKARAAWQHQVDGHALQALHPHRLRAGDTLLWGGVCLDGIAVGVSGAFDWFDEAFATAIAANLRAIAKGRVDAARGRRELRAGGA